MKIGFGYDIHELKKGRPLVIGGVKIPFHLGLSGHSDADVLLHAVCDALLGAVGLGDIGIHFPNTDKKYKNISSLILLNEVSKKIAQSKIVNIDTVIIADEPKLSFYFPIMRKNIAKVLKISSAQVNIKATTTEGCLFPPRKKAVISYAVAIIISKAGNPIAKIIPFKNKKIRKFGTAKGKVIIHDDFDKALPDDIMEYFV